MFLFFIWFDFVNFLGGEMLFVYAVDVVVVAVVVNFVYVIVWGSFSLICFCARRVCWSVMFCCCFVLVYYGGSVWFRVYGAKQALLVLIVHTLFCVFSRVIPREKGIIAGANALHRCCYWSLPYVSPHQSPVRSSGGSVRCVRHLYFVHEWVERRGEGVKFTSK